MVSGTPRLTWLGLTPLTANRLGNAHRCQALYFVAIQGAGLATGAVEFDLHVAGGRHDRTSAHLHDPVVDARTAIGDEALGHAQLNGVADIGGCQHPGSDVAVIPEQFDQIAFVHCGVGRHLDQQMRGRGDVDAGLVGLRQGRCRQLGCVRGSCHLSLLEVLQRSPFLKNRESEFRTAKLFITFELK